jgi:uncharacterized iron-regulated protein
MVKVKANWKVCFVAFLFLLFHSIGLAQEISDAFILYTGKGKRTDFTKMKDKLSDKEFVFFGEFHDNPISHWLELELLIALHQTKGVELQVGMEMFEQDQQALLDAYASGAITDKQFKDSARLWPNYKTDYKPILEYSRANGISMAATNVPRKYASLLFKKGRLALDSLSNLEKSWMAPLDFKVDTNLSQYAALNEMAQHMSGKNFVEAQAFKDATMAYFCLKHKREGTLFLHINGAYHSDFYQGIIWYLQAGNQKKKVGTISTVTQKDINKLEKEHLGKADFIICVPERMTPTH